MLILIHGQIYIANEHVYILCMKVVHQCFHDECKNQAHMHYILMHKYYHNTRIKDAPNLTFQCYV